MHRRVYLLALAAGLALGASVHAADPSKPRVTLRTSMGVIVLALDAQRAPGSVENFLAYVKQGHYDGTIFHRVIPGFMVQGGGFSPIFEEKETRDPIRNEAGNGLRNVRGSVAMARTGRPHSATAQFFINVVDNAFLDHRAQSQSGWGYAVFGHVVEGMDVVERIQAVPTGVHGPYRDVPRTPIVVESATLDTPKTAE